MTGSGTSSVVADDLVLTVENLPLGQFGLVFSGPSEMSPVVFGDGLLCAAGGLYRFGVRAVDGSGTLTEGPGIVGWTQAHFAIGGRIDPGETWRFQCWYRDPVGPCGATYSSSNGVSVLFE